MSLDQLQPYFGLRDRPFRADVAPSALQRSTAHQEAIARIAYLVQAGALGLITGEVSCGKTTALRAASAALDASRHTVIYLPNPAIGARGIIAEIIARLGGTPRFHKSALIPQAQDLLLREREERKKRVLLIIDEAHLLSAEQLEELRLLSNSEMDSIMPFAGILVGQPQLRRRLRLGSFAALDQRIALRYELPGMTRTETDDYSPTTYASPAARTASSATTPSSCCTNAHAGIPRALNNLATQALVATYIAQKSIVDTTAAHAAVAEVYGE